MSTLISYFSSRQEAMLELIRVLVERETKSRDEACLNEIARFVADHFLSLGGEVRLLNQPNYGSHLRARFFDRGARTPHLFVLGHLDTVWPIGTLHRLPFRITEEGRAYGPGIFDMKSGIAILIEALRAIIELGFETRRPVSVLLTCDEEIGSHTSRLLIEEEARGAVAVFVLEPPITGGTVKTARKGIGTYTLRAIGRAAHSGLDPSKGINAIVELAHQTLRLAELNDFDRGTTVSIGTVNGGTAINVIPAEATACIDVRFWEIEEGQRIDATIRGLQSVHPEAQLEIRGGINRPPMKRSPESIALYQHACTLAAELGFELKEGSVGGGSDGNFTAALGVPTLDGLGVDGAGAHAEHEHIIVADLPCRAALLMRLLQTT